jgi:ABC-2 type transport system ATP-binding protein
LWFRRGASKNLRVIAVENLTKEFGNTRAVRGVSFRVEKGEIIGLLGPNGSGKTTIMRILTGFFPPTSGRAEVAGIDVSTEPLAARACVGYLPESAALYPDMRVGQFLEFVADVHGIVGARKRRRIESVVEGCGLGEVRKRLVGKLSKGYRQRVGLAQALLHEPEVLILDEPTVGLDPRQIVEIRDLIRALRGRTTVLLSTHILPEASTVCERVVIIDRGRIVAEDTAEGLTRGLQGGDRLLVRVGGPAAEVTAALGAVDGVDGVDAVGSMDAQILAADGTVSLLLRCSSPQPVSPAVASLVVQKGWALLELRPYAMTLEDLFVRLVTEESEGNAP